MSDQPAKAKKYLVKFNESWSQKFRSFQKSRKGENYALCIVCGCDFSIGNGGENDINKHNSTPININNFLILLKIKKS